MNAGFSNARMSEFLPLTTLYLPSFGRVVMLGKKGSPSAPSCDYAGRGSGAFVFAACLDAEFPFGLLPVSICARKFQTGGGWEY